MTFTFTTFTFTFTTLLQFGILKVCTSVLFFQKKTIFEKNWVFFLENVKWNWHFLIFPNCRKGDGFSSYKMPKKSYEWFRFNWPVFSRHVFPIRGHQHIILLSYFYFACTNIKVTRHYVAKITSHDQNVTMTYVGHHVPDYGFPWRYLARLG